MRTTLMDNLAAFRELQRHAGFESHQAGAVTSAAERAGR